MLGLNCVTGFIFQKGRSRFVVKIIKKMEDNLQEFLLYGGYLLFQDLGGLVGVFLCDYEGGDILTVEPDIAGTMRRPSLRHPSLIITMGRSSTGASGSGGPAAPWSPCP